MITTIDITLLPETLQDMVRSWYRDVVKEESHLMSYEECAWFYGYTYQTIRHYVSTGVLRAVGRAPQRRIRHRDMRAYLQRRKRPGSPTKAVREKQLRIDKLIGER